MDILLPTIWKALRHENLVCKTVQIGDPIYTSKLGNIFWREQMAFSLTNFAMPTRMKKKIKFDKAFPA